VEITIFVIEVSTLTVNTLYTLPTPLVSFRLSWLFWKSF